MRTPFAFWVTCGHGGPYNRSSMAFRHVNMGLTGLFHWYFVWLLFPTLHALMCVEALFRRRSKSDSTAPNHAVNNKLRDGKPQTPGSDHTSSPSKIVKAKDLQTELRVGVRDNSNPNPTLRNFGFRFLPGLRGTKPRTAKPCAWKQNTFAKLNLPSPHTCILRNSCVNACKHRDDKFCCTMRCELLLRHLTMPNNNLN